MGNSAGALKHHIATAEKTGALAFSEKKLDEFPQALSKTSGVLRNLDLSRNKIPAIPSSIGNFKMLKTLRLSENRLTGLPEEIGNLEKLENLFLSVNLISALPNSMERLKNLKVLDVSQNLLQSLPAFLIRLKKLDTVNLSKNKVTSLPPDLSALSTTELSLNQNQVTVVPESLARAPRLRTLRLEENCLNLEGIPKELLADSKVSTLALAGNLFDEKKLLDVEGYDKYMERYTAVKRKLD